jgi:dTMP kinase
MFLAFDGIDGSGKTTQAELLAQWLRAQDYDVVCCRDPGSTAVGEAVRKIVLEPGPAPLSLPAEMLLYMAARAQLVAEVVRPALAAGKCVISDRFLLANVVYQGHAGGLDPEVLWQIGMLACGGLMPGVTIVLDLPVEAAVARIRRPLDRMEQRGRAFAQAVRDGFLAEARRRPGQIVVLDATLPIEQVQQQVREIAARMLSHQAAGSAGRRVP